MSKQQTISHFCLDLLLKRDPTAPKDRPALLRGKRWSRGEELVIGFMDQSDEMEPLRERVLAALRPWRIYTKGFRLNFYPRPDQKADIRIAFGQDVSWSCIGTDCRKEPYHLPTMQLALNLESSDEDVLSIARHEFGHALGLIHEHSSPAAGIRWNRTAVIDFLTKKGWSEPDIEENYFKVYNATQTQYTEFDPASIMLYQIPRGFLEDESMEYPLNTDLSPMDIDFISTQYFLLK